jgi:hypothetical protein
VTTTRHARPPPRDTTPEEDEAIKEVEALRKGLEELTTSSPDETDTIADAKKELDEKERALYTLQVRRVCGVSEGCVCMWVGRPGARRQCCSTP